MRVNESELDGVSSLRPELVRVMRTDSLTQDENMRYLLGSTGTGWDIDFAVICDPMMASTPQGQRRPGAANSGQITRDLIYESLIRE